MSEIDPLTAVMESPGLEQAARRTYDWSEVDPSAAAATLLAEVENCEPDEIGPLYERLNTDVLDSLTASEPQHTTQFRISFPYERYLVSIRSEGEITVYRTDEPS